MNVPHNKDTASTTAAAERRPLTSRDTGWARSLARQAAARGITPNHISIASMGFAALAATTLLLAAFDQGRSGIFWFLLAALGCQLRLVCNLIDGMVAIEGGHTSATGALWNELPDRVSDVMILAAAGVVADMPALGWAAASMAVMTAYVRELGHRLTGTVDFGGWMAKPQRMAVVTAACVLAMLARLLGGSADVAIFQVAVAVVFLGSLWVSFARTQHILQRLRDAYGSGDKS